MADKSDTTTSGAPHSGAPAPESSTPALSVARGGSSSASVAPAAPAKVPLPKLAQRALGEMYRRQRNEQDTLIGEVAFEMGLELGPEPGQFQFDGTAGVFVQVPAA